MRRTILVVAALGVAVAVPPVARADSSGTRTAPFDHGYTSVSTSPNGDPALTVDSAAARLGVLAGTRGPLPFFGPCLPHHGAPCLPPLPNPNAVGPTSVAGIRFEMASGEAALVDATATFTGFGSLVVRGSRGSSMTSAGYVAESVRLTGVRVECCSSGSTGELAIEVHGIGVLRAITYSIRTA